MAENKNSDTGREVYSTAGDRIKIKNSLKSMQNFNTSIADMMQKIKAFPLTRDQKNNDEIEKLHQEVDQIIDRETERFVSSEAHADGKSLAEFINNLFTKKPKDGIQGLTGALLQNQTIESLMNDENGRLNMLLSERYKNLNSMYEDIRLVTEQLAELAEVIDTFRDNIVNSDNMIADISRIIQFGSKDSGDATATLVSIVESMEDATGIKNKLKYIIIPETLKYGNFFVFAQPYSDFFAKFKALDLKYQKMGSGNYKSINEMSHGFESWVNVLENYTPTEIDKADIHTLYESFSADFKSINKGAKEYSKDSLTEEKFSGLVESYFAENVSIVNDPMVPLLEDYNVMALSDPQLRTQIAKAMKDKKNSRNWNPIQNNAGKVTGFQDGALDYKGDTSKIEEKFKQEFGDINGVFMKCYHPKRVIPIFVMDYCIGYYLIYETLQDTTSNVLNSIHTLTRSTRLFQTNRTREFEERFIGLIADRICRNIDKPFLKKNSKFKELIANAIQYDNFYKKSFRVQFVTSNYMTHFKINEDYTTHLGQSVLYRSLFYAMLYLTLLLFKILMIMTRQGDIRMFLIKGNGTNKDVSGKMNKIISDFKQKQISYNDFGSVNGILSKVGQGKDIGVPVGANNERAFDIEMLQGSNVELDEPLLELLRKGMISNTGCPSAIINYMEEVDFAKQISMTQAKFITRIISLQCELEPACTDLYRKLLRFGGYNISDDDLDSFQFLWSRPRALNTQNIGDLIGTADQLAEFMVKVFEGDNSINDPRIKDRFLSFFVRKYLLNGVFDWDELDKELTAISLELRANIQEEEATKIATGEGEQ